MSSERPLRVLGVADGRSLNVARWARVLAERGHEVHLVSGRFPDRPEELDGITVHDIRRLGLATRIPGLRRLAFVPALRRLARRLRPDIVHAHYMLPYGWWAARAGLRPLVQSPWSRDVFIDARTPPGAGRVREAIGAADWLVLNSYANERATLELGGDPERISHIIWYAELGRFGPRHADPGFRARFGWPEEALVVLSLRNLLPYKNIDVVVRAFARAAAGEPRARLVLASRGGPLRQELEELVAELEIADRVVFYRAEWEELPTVAASSDLAISIADTDSTPASLLEVMKSGLPVVCGIAPSIEEWVKQGEGAEIVACRDEDAVAAALARLLADPDLRRRYGERNLRVVQERLPEEPGPALERLYRELVAG